MNQKRVNRSSLKCEYPRWVYLIMAIGIAFIFGINQSHAAEQPILTKSGKKAALMKAAADLQAKAGSASLLGLPSTATDESVVPHYFGPFPNWANSPFTLPDAEVNINGNGSGTGATAVATIGGNGSITDITVTNPGRWYTDATTVLITGSGVFATAEAVVDTSGGSITSVNVDAQGAGYTAPIVSFSTGSAAATAYGGVDTITITNPGSGYTNPTVDFDMPDGPDGVKATANVTWDGASGAITGINIVQPGSGYSVAPKMIIRNGTLYDPISPTAGFVAATATTTVNVQTIDMDVFGTGYTAAPAVTISDATGTGSGAMGYCIDQHRCDYRNQCHQSR